MSIKYSTSIILPVRPEQAWQVCSQMKDWPHWTNVFRPHRLPDIPWKEGATLVVTSRLSPLLPGLKLKVHVIECLYPHSLVWEGRFLGIYGKHGFSFNADGDNQCRLVHYEELFGLPVPLLKKFGMIDQMKAKFEEFNHHLLTHLRVMEDQHPITQP